MPPPLLTTVYASDEDLCVRATGDFAILCPAWQKTAYGADGVFDSGTPWVLTSATIDFEAQGVAVNNVVHLTKPTATFKGGGELLAVQSATGGAATLRRVGMDVGVGSPPGGTAGVTGVEFTVATMAPQIEEASFAINRRWNIDPNIPGRAPTDLRDLRELREVTVLTVLLNRYVAENRTERGDFPIKIDAMRRALSEVEARLEIRWGAADGDANPPSNLFSMRLVRG